MANQLKQLYELQTLEIDAEQKRERLKQIQVQLRDREAVVQAEAKLEQEKENLAKLNQEQRAVEWQVEDVTTKAKAIEEKLYGGQVKIPKELVGLQKDLQSLKSNKRQLEDKVLEMMTQADEQKNKVSICEVESAKATQLWEESQNQLKTEQTELDRAATDLEDRSKRLRMQIDKSYISLYDRLRSNKAGQGVARVEQGMCLGCRISLPIGIVQRVRLGEEIVQCPSCSRIMV